MNLVSHRAAMSMLFLASSIATNAVRLSGRSVPSRSRRSDVPLCNCQFVFFFLGDFPLSTEDEVEQRVPW